MTVRGRLFPSKDQARELNRFMRAQSSGMRYAYSRLCEGKPKAEIESDLKRKFPELNSRYCRGGYFRAKFTHASALELVKAGELESPRRVVFGGRNNLRRRERGEISNEEWKRLRNNQLYSRGDRSKGGNLNLRFVQSDGALCLRVNAGDRKWIHIPAYLSNHVDEILSGETPYGVRALRKNPGYELRVCLEEDHEPRVGFEKGAVGIDFNQPTIDLAVTNEQGQLKTTKTMECHAVTSARRQKREWLIGNLAKEVVDFAKYWKRGLVIERLRDVARGRRNQHEFVHRGFLEAVKRRAEREGVAVREVNPAYTSVIGAHKYAPYYHITIHQAAALVVARRGQGFSERLRGLKSLLFEAREAGEGKEGAPSRRVHSWRLWRMMRDLPSRKGTDSTHLGQSPETMGVESPGTRGPTERSLGGDDAPGREIASPGSGPPTQPEEVAA